MCEALRPLPGLGGLFVPQNLTTFVWSDSRVVGFEADKLNHGSCHVAVVIWGAAFKRSESLSEMGVVTTASRLSWAKWACGGERPPGSEPKMLDRRHRLETSSGGPRRVRGGTERRDRYWLYFLPLSWNLRLFPGCSAAGPRAA